MKKLVLVFLVVAAITVVGVPASHAAEYASSPTTNDSMTVLNRFELDGYAHAVITYNYSDDTAFVVVLDPDGYTDTVYLGGFAYLFADYYTGTLYGSADGVNWYSLGSI